MYGQDEEKKDREEVWELKFRLRTKLFTFKLKKEACVLDSDCHLKGYTRESCERRTRSLKGTIILGIYVKLLQEREESMESYYSRHPNSKNRIAPSYSNLLHHVSKSRLPVTRKKHDDVQTEAEQGVQLQARAMLIARSVRSTGSANWEQVHNHDENDVFANVRRHSEQILNPLKPYVAGRRID
ncbi:hypothetical protein Tco_0534771 [Tanacetum coccineum]